MSGTAERQAWADFWNRGGGGGCLASAAHPIGQAQRAVWEELARQLPKGSKVLDIGSGDGAALAHFARVRSDLELTGVDSSTSLPPPPENVTLLANVEAERLPFEDGSFDAVVSQFGFEYADTGRAAAEIGRVVIAGGRVRLMIHRRDSAVVEHNLGRRQALRWAIGCGLLERAREMLGDGSILPRIPPEEMRTALDEARRRFPSQSVAAEFTAAVAQTIATSRDSNSALERLDVLAAKATSEIARLDALERAARDEDGVDRVLADLRLAGIAAEPARSIEEVGNGRPFAWLIDGARQAQA